jgi:hypothetical protein
VRESGKHERELEEEEQTKMKKNIRKRANEDDESLF